MRVLRLKEAYPTAKIELWCEDEHRLGLKPIIRKVWAPIGRRPTAKVHQRYEWTYLYAFARPKSGEVFWLILPTVNAEVFSMALGAFRQGGGGGHQKTRPLGAGWCGVAHGQEQAEGTRRDTPGVSASALPGATALRKALAFVRRGFGEPLLWSRSSSWKRLWWIAARH